jgi:hypothetical protein
VAKRGQLREERETRENAREGDTEGNAGERALSTDYLDRQSVFSLAFPKSRVLRTAARPEVGPYLVPSRLWVHGGAESKPEYFLRLFVANVPGFEVGARASSQPTLFAKNSGL